MGGLIEITFRDGRNKAISAFENRLPTEEFYTEVARGNIEGHSFVHKFGKNDAVGTSLVPICNAGVYQMPQVANATTLRVKIGNANDTAAGSGAREITLIGLTETGAEVTETIPTAGTSAGAASTATFLRLDRAYVSKSGTYPTAVGAHSQAADIVIENGSGGTDWLTIKATMAQSHVGAYAIPLGKTAFINGFFSTVDSNKAHDLHLFMRKNILQAAAPYSGFRVQTHVVGLKDPLIPSFKIPVGPFEELTDLVWVAKVGTGTASVSIDFEVHLIDN